MHEAVMLTTRTTTADLPSLDTKCSAARRKAAVKVNHRIELEDSMHQTDSESTIRTGMLVVNLDTRTVLVSDRPVHLTGKEYAILELLSLRKGTTLTKEMFLN